MTPPPDTAAPETAVPDQLSATPPPAPAAPTTAPTTTAATTAEPTATAAAPDPLAATRLEVSDGTETRTIDVRRDASVPGMVRGNIGTLTLPAEKGPEQWRKLYDDLARAGQLQTIIEFSGNTPNPQAGLWQKRADSSELRRLWLVRMGWPKDKANQWWNEAGGDKPKSEKDEFKPKTKTIAAQIDHVVELQLGGSNVPENLAPHDGADNEESGREIWRFASGWAVAVRKAAAAATGKSVGSVALEFSDVEQPKKYEKPTKPLAPLPPPQTEGTDTTTPSKQEQVIAARKGTGAEGTAGSALQVHFTALQDKDAGTRPSPQDVAAAEAKLGPLTDYTIIAGANTATLRVPGGHDPVAIEDSPVRANDAARELIPGMTLIRLVRGTNPHHVEGLFGRTNKASAEEKESGANIHAVRSGTRVPISVNDGAGRKLTFNVGTDGRLKLPTRGEPVNFVYPYLSRGRLTLNLTDTGLEGIGTLTPSVPLLSRAIIGVHLADGRLDGTVALDKTKLHVPAPLQVRDASVNVSLAPTLAVDGRIALAVGDLLDAELTATVDSSGFVARGLIRAHIPHLDQAEGKVEYRPGPGFSGFVVVGASPGGPIRTAQVRLSFDGSGFGATGFVDLALPGGDNTAHLEVRRHDDRLVYYGHAHLNVPGLQPVDAEIRYDGKTVEGTAKTTFKLFDAKGDITVYYREGRFSGKGHAALDRGKFSGSLDVELDDQGDITGHGRGSYTFRPGLVGTAEVELDRHHKLHVKGEMRFPPYQFMDRHGDSYQLFRLDLPPIPIFGFSIGVKTFGIVATVGAGLSADYWFGPGEIRDGVISASFDPLEDDTNLDLHAGARLVIPAHAGLTLKARLGLGLSAAVATLTGGVDLGASLGLDGRFDAALDLHFARGVLTVDATAGFSFQPAFVFTVGVDFTIDTWVHTWTWERELARYRFESGLTFGMAVPIHYATNEPFRLPSAHDIRWTVPNIDLGELAHRVGDRVYDYVTS